MERYNARKVVDHRVSMFDLPAPLYRTKKRLVNLKIKNPVVDGRIVINVKGARYVTYVATLENFPKTMLGDPQKRERYLDRMNGEIKLSRDQQCFEAVLFYYQSNGILSKPEWVSEENFENELHFYELKECRKSKQETNRNACLNTMWTILEKPTKSVYAQIFGLFSLLAIIVSITMLCLETVYHSRTKKYEKIFFVVESACVVWFTGEYCCRAMSAPNRYLFMRSFVGILDILVIMPFYLTLIVGQDSKILRFYGFRVLRMFRVFRVFKLTRYSVGLKVLGKTITESVGQLCTLFLCLLIAVVVFSSMLFYIEQSPDFVSIPETFWFTIISMTTVGYGDITPKTIMGKMTTALCVVSGLIILLCLPAPVFITHFGRFYTKVTAKVEEPVAVEDEDRPVAAVLIPWWMQNGDAKCRKDSALLVPGLRIYLSTQNLKRACSTDVQLHKTDDNA